ncbi:TonB-dependent siderophore receptor [Methylobacterium sp. J-076]|uniref:TonB-dependent siderophore receptor n=1 Tax=Methylobacterium sp. J-076 TaxID=2836655 RepID=UPI001FB93407|nr:TonB-dependent siderophore receptor [Methylobacterium sp. J-076]MCJ2012837.1 TonB-dependent siderophore receptor [Methylobacterium sp. J-076]
MTDRPTLLALLLAASALSAPASLREARAQETALQLDEISVEAVRGDRSGQGTGANVAVSQDSAATSGGGGGPSGVTGYVARVSPSATKTNTPLIETPQSVTVITREQLNDRNVQTVNEALGYAAGTATNVFGFDPRYDSFYVRGFDLTYNGIFRDGIRQVGNNLTLPRVEPYGLEAATILRGPSSGLYGLGSPGGILDLTTKRPVFTRFGEMQLQVGNYDRYQGNVDIGGPVEGTDGTLAYRLTGLRREANTFLPGSADDRTYIAPAFTWRPDADTTFTFLSEYQDSKLPGNASFYNAPGFVSTRLYSGDPAFNDFKLRQGRVGYAFEHHISEDLIVRQNFRFYDTQNSYQYAQIDSLSADGTTASRTAGYLRERLSQISLDNQVEAHGRTGPVQHTLLGGLDYVHYDFTTRSGFAAAPDLDLTALNYGRQFIAAPALGPRSTQSQDQLGLYLQDQAKLARFILTLSGRYDWTFQETFNGGTDTASRQDDRAFTGRVGLSYLLAPGLVPYASYATNFTPQVGVDAQGRAFKPSTGDQIEAGVKYLIPGTNIQTTVSGFDIVQSSILRPDPNDLTKSIATGSVRSRGFEMEAIANLAPGTNLTLAYTHLNLEYLNQTSASGQVLDGNTVSGIPGDTFAGFVGYLFPAGSPLRGLTLGGGLRFMTHSFGNDENTFRNPTVTLFDALVAYDFAAIDPKFQGLRAQINGYNIFDRDYATCQAGYCYRGAPATVIGSLIYRW